MKKWTPKNFQTITEIIEELSNYKILDEIPAETIIGIEKFIKKLPKVAAIERVLEIIFYPNSWAYVVRYVATKEALKDIALESEREKNRNWNEQLTAMKNKAKLTPQQIMMLPDDLQIIDIKDEAWEEFLESRKQMRKIINRGRKPKITTMFQSLKQLTKHYDKIEENKQ